jgi:hypothetical protein
VSKPATRAPRGNPAAAKVLEAIRWEIDADADAVRTGAFVDEAEHSAMPDGGMRVSDAERDAALEMLGEHASVGRLTLDELEDRAGRMLAAKTRAEVQELTSDLPPEPAVPARRRRPARWLVAVLGGSQRRGRFRAAGTVNMIALMGGDGRPAPAPARRSAGADPRLQPDGRQHHLAAPAGSPRQVAEGRPQAGQGGRARQAPRPGLAGLSAGRIAGGCQRLALARGG